MVLKRAFVIPAQKEDLKCRDRERRRVVGRARDHEAGVPECGGSLGFVETKLREENLVAMGEPRMGGGVVRVQLERVLQNPRGDPGVGGRHRGHVRQRAQIEVIGVEIVGMLSPGAFDLRALQAGLDDADDLVGDLVLQVENVFQRAVVAVGPQMRPGRGLDQLRRDAHPVARLAHASFQDIAHAELTPDLSHIDGSALVGEARIARDHEQPFDPRQAGDDVLDHAVGEILLLRIAAHVLERQDRDRRPVGRCEVRQGLFGRSGFN